MILKELFSSFHLSEAIAAEEQEHYQRAMKMCAQQDDHRMDYTISFPLITVEKLPALIRQYFPSSFNSLVPTASAVSPLLCFPHLHLPRLSLPFAFSVHSSNYWIVYVLCHLVLVKQFEQCQQRETFLARGLISPEEYMQLPGLLDLDEGNMNTSLNPSQDYENDCRLYLECCPLLERGISPEELGKEEEWRELQKQLELFLRSF